MLKRTPFYDFHVSAGAKFVDFAGWEMPLYYRGIIDEHEQTRRSGSIFDVSHMGRLHFSGKDAVAFLNHVLTRNVSEQRSGQSRYSLVCNDAGGVLDDVIVSRDVKHWILVCNASNRVKLVTYFNDVRKERSFDLDFSDQTESTAMAAIQGPKVIEKIADILPVDIRGLKRYGFESSSFLMTKFSVFRSGYTGEDGVEVVIPAKVAGMAIKMLAGKTDRPEATIKPAGLGARHIAAGGGDAALRARAERIARSARGRVGLGGRSQEGIRWRRCPAQVAEKGPPRKLVGLELEGRRIARQGTAVKSGEEVVGEVTSGTFGPTVQKSIAMAYVDSNFATEGTQLAVDLKGTLNPAKVVKLPFYKRAGS